MAAQIEQVITGQEFLHRVLAERLSRPKAELTRGGSPPEGEPHRVVSAGHSPIRGGRVRRIPLAAASVPVVVLTSLLACGSKTPVTPPEEEPVDTTAIVVPGCPAPTLDGTVSPEEWSRAKVVTLAGGAELRMMHAAGYLYLALRPKRYPVVNACFERGTAIMVAHTSGSLGTAVYERVANGLYATTGWTEWCCGDSTATPALTAAIDAYLVRRGWTAPNGFLGVPEDMEIKIAMPDNRLRLALTYVGAADMADGGSWPGSVFPVGLADGCSDRALLTVGPPSRTNFAPERWATIVAGPAAP